jgi:hypothetical protein
MSFDAIEKQNRLEHKSGETIQEMIPVVSGWCALGKQVGAARSAISDIGRDNFDLGRNMSYGHLASWLQAQAFERDRSFARSCSGAQILARLDCSLGTLPARGRDPTGDGPAAA